jgi:hypothetical protein
MNSGTCATCLQTIAKSQMRRHLRQCPGGGEGLLIEVTNAGTPKQYWLYLSAAPSATLEELDAVLRAVWLECCGHLSSFEIGGRGGASYQSHAGTGFLGEDEVRGLDELMASALPPDTFAAYRYDFGTTTALELRRHEQGVLPPGARALALLARNLAPGLCCDRCSDPARWVDWQQTLCEGCHHELAEDEQELMLPLCNSPRAGFCGYDGADDPFAGGVRLAARTC